METKQIGIRFNEEQLVKFNKVAGNSYIDKIMGLIEDNAGEKKNSIAPQLTKTNCLVCERRSKGVKIPYTKWTKDEIAEFLDIGQLDKRWVNFMDNVERIYYEN